MEKKYYYSDNGVQVGPYALEELSSKHITENTLIWHEGIVNWMRAGEIPELSGIINHATPPPVTNKNYIKNSVAPNSHLTQAILVTVFCCWPLGIPAIIAASKVERHFYSGDTEEAQRQSDKAQKWMTISFICGIAYLVIYLTLLLTGTIDLDYITNMYY